MRKNSNRSQSKNPVKDVINVTKATSVPEWEMRNQEDAGSNYISIKLNLQKKEKKRLANFIVDKYIKDLFAVAIDAGSTQQQIIERIMEKKNFLSILTNNMTAFRQNSKQRVKESANEFILTGGKYVALFDALHGIETQNSFETFNPNVVVIGVSGLVPDKGFLCHGNDEVNIKKLLFTKKAPTIIIPIDYKKLGRLDSYSFGTIEGFRNMDGNNRIVVACPPSEPEEMDTEIEKKFKEENEAFRMNIDKLRKHGVEVEIVPDDYEAE